MFDKILVILVHKELYYYFFKKLIITVLVSYNFNIQALIYSAFKICALKPWFLNRVRVLEFTN